MSLLMMDCRGSRHGHVHHRDMSRPCVLAYPATALSGLVRPQVIEDEVALI
jgi:hypothetical protein